MIYDLAFVRHCAKDMIVSASGIRVVDGGAFNASIRGSAPDRLPWRVYGLGGGCHQPQDGS